MTFNLLFSRLIFDFKTCRIRIPHHHEKPSIWSPEEDKELNKLVQQYGHKWIQIAKYFPTRTEIQIKNRCYSNQRKIVNQSVSPSQTSQKNKSDPTQQNFSFFMNK